MDIEIEGACTVSLKTNDTRETVAIARKVCQTAETPANANGAEGVSVVGNGVESAAGTKKLPCAVKV